MQKFSDYKLRADFLFKVTSQEFLALLVKFSTVNSKAFFHILQHFALYCCSRWNRPLG